MQHWRKVKKHKFIILGEKDHPFCLRKLKDACLKFDLHTYDLMTNH
jgi:hypothetical protein